MTKPKSIDTELREKIEKASIHEFGDEFSQFLIPNFFMDNLVNLISQEVIKARKEAVDYFYWRIDCSTMISELEGWRGCIDNAKDQTERHFAQLRATELNKEDV